MRASISFRLLNDFMSCLLFFTFHLSFLRVHERFREELHQRSLNERLAQQHRCHEYQQEECRDDGEGPSRSYNRFYPVDGGKREVEQYQQGEYRDEDGHDKDHRDAHHLVDNVQLHKFLLQQEILLEFIDQLDSTFLSLEIIGEWGEWGLFFVGGSLFQFVHQFVHLVFLQLDVVLLQKLLGSVADFLTGVRALLGGKNKS